MHNLIVKTGSYDDINYKNIEKEIEIDKVIQNIEYDYTDDILRMNDILKHNKKQIKIFKKLKYIYRCYNKIIINIILQK